MSGISANRASEATPLLRTLHRSSALDSLSPREMKVLALVAEGHTNASLAATLFLSERTVMAHVRSVFTKLGLVDDGATDRRIPAVVTYLESQRAKGPRQAHAPTCDRRAVGRLEKGRLAGPRFRPGNPRWEPCTWTDVDPPGVPQDPFGDGFGDGMSTGAAGRSGAVSVGPSHGGQSWDDATDGHQVAAFGHRQESPTRAGMTHLARGQIRPCRGPR